MLTPQKTCKCGQVWRWSSSEPSPITPEGCPVCSSLAADALSAGSLGLVQKAIDALVMGEMDKS